VNLFLLFKKEGEVGSDVGIKLQEPLMKENRFAVMRDI
jgi:hypothetical protein